jgi:hypothetical protein
MLVNVAIVAATPSHVKNPATRSSKGVNMNEHQAEIKVKPAAKCWRRIEKSNSCRKRLHSSDLAHILRTPINKSVIFFSAAWHFMHHILVIVSAIPQSA